jgi:hypothetical protein
MCMYHTYDTSASSLYVLCIRILVPLSVVLYAVWKASSTVCVEGSERAEAHSTELEHVNLHSAES